MTHTTKRGSYDNVITYEHMCDTTEDLQKIKPEYINLGSVAIVLQGDNGLEVYMANSQKEWVPLLENSGGGDEGGSDMQVLHMLPQAREITWSDYHGSAQGTLENVDFTNFFSIFPDRQTYNCCLTYSKIKIDDTEYIHRGLGMDQHTNTVDFAFIEDSYFSWNLIPTYNIACFSTDQFTGGTKSLIEYIDIYYQPLISK